MKIEELRNILDLVPWEYIRAGSLRKPMSQEMLDEALQNMEPVYRERLNAFVGKQRKDWGSLQLPKLSSGYMKPGYANACYGLRVSLNKLARALRCVPSQISLADEGIVCPHCGEKLTVKVKIEKRPSV